MSLFHIRPVRRALAAGAWTVFLGVMNAAPVAAADNFEVNLGPSAHDDATKSLMTGRGAGTAVLADGKLTFRGTFNGLVSPATDAHVRLGAAIGAPGPIIFDLAVTKSTGGTLMGSFALDARQLAALRGGRMYIQVNSEKAAEPYGNMWGWLLPAYAKVDKDVPQAGHWYLPQLDVPKN